MKLFEGGADEYKRRHDQIWPELSALLKQTGISNYSIFLDHETMTLFGVMDVADEIALDALSEQPVMKRWWAYMKDLMEANPDNSPVSVPLEQVFFLG